MRIKVFWLLTGVSLCVVITLLVEFFMLTTQGIAFSKEVRLLWESDVFKQRELLDNEISTNDLEEDSDIADIVDDSALRDSLLEMLMSGFATNVQDGENFRHAMTYADGEECECEGEFVYGPLSDKDKQRRDDKMEIWEDLQYPAKEPIVMCNAMSPITYVGGGITVEPLHRVRLVGISIDELFWRLFLQNGGFDITFTSLKSYGVMTVHKPKNMSEYAKVQGNGSPKLTISVSGAVELNDLNLLLKQIQYQSTLYDIELREIVSIRLQGFEVKVHVHIYRQPFPRLYNTSPEDKDISRKVTIVTKTFERYDVVRKLIESIREFYPKINILIADDSKEPEKLEGKRIKHYIMPFARGWFAGRNLLVSQVRTKYFVWVDDDFIFTKNTKLERFLEKFEAPNSNLDLIAGRYEDKQGKLIDRNFDHVIDRQRGKDGYCMTRRKGNYGPVEGFPQCNRSDEVTNFFMAKTLSVRDIGFDPSTVLSRVAHYEFFWDGLGRLRVASCNDVTVQHFFTHDNSDIYEQYRRGENDDIHYYERLLYSIYKNNMKCLTGMDRNIQDLAKFQAN